MASLALRAFSVFAMAITFLLTPVMGSQVHHRTLEEVMALGTPVVRATVKASRVDIGPNELTVAVDIVNVRGLRGQAEEEGTITHRFSTLIERPGPDGKTVRVSPMRDGSGLEQNLVPGRAYIFILDATGREFLRAENLEAEGRVRACFSSGLDVLPGLE